MTTQALRDGPGPMVLRAAPDNDDQPLGSVLIDFYPDRVSVAVMAGDSATEAVIRARLDDWTHEHVRGLTGRCPNASSAGTGCGGRCRCREAGR